MDIVDRVCQHARLYCPEGCHDLVPYEPSNAGVELVLDLAEMWANDDVPEFEGRLDERSGKDGLEEVTETAMLLLTERT